MSQTMEVETPRRTGVLRWVGAAYVVAAVFMVPWMVLLANTLPATATARNWSLAWVGLDGLMTVGLAVTGLLAWRHGRSLALAATVTGTLLAVDAWFDVLTSAPGADFAEALTLALCCEIPVAICCFALAGVAHRAHR